MKLYSILFELGPSAQGLGSYDDRFEVRNGLDRAEDMGLLDLCVDDDCKDSEDSINPLAIDAVINKVQVH